MSNLAHKLSSEPDVDIYFQDKCFQPLSSGALFWPEQRMLLVADLHLEKLSSFAGSGQLLPPYDTRQTLAHIEADLGATGANRLIALGDSFHRDAGTRTLQDQDRARLNKLTTQIDWVWLSGNHDPAPHNLGGECYPDLEVDGLLLCHEPSTSGPSRIAGHLHPAARIRLNGRSTRRRCFVADDHLMILPAYGSSTGALNILDEAFDGLLDRSRLQVVMVGKDRVYPVNPKRLCRG